MGAIEDIYADLDADVSEEEFRAAVEAKVEQMGGLADEETAAMLVAHEAADQQVAGVADIEPGMNEAKFVAKVVSVGELRTFERDDGSEGHVVNAEVADETGVVRAAFWDEQADAATDELEVGQTLRIAGRPREGYSGVEVSVDRVEVDEELDIEVGPQDGYTIRDLSLGHSDVTLRGKVLDAGSVRTFERDDGSEGRVSNLVLGDETGRIRVTLWDERADLAEEIPPGTSVEVVDGYVRERDGALELHVGSRGRVEGIDETVEYVPETTPIAEIEVGETVDIAGVVRSADPVRTFDRDDGSEGQVRNVRVQDGTGDVRVALWGEKADTDLGPGDEVLLADVEIQDGWKEAVEASAGWRSTVTKLDDGTSPVADDTKDATDGVRGADTSAGEASTDAPGGPGLDAFAGDTDAEDTDDAAASVEGATSGDEDDEGDAEETQVEFTGVVVQAGDPVIIDDGERTVRVETGAQVTLGQEVTVRGTLRGDRLEADDVLP